MTKHNISLQTAVDMTAFYREQMNSILAAPYQDKGILPLCETFDRQAVDLLLSEADCQALRVYYGMAPDEKIHSILVGVNSNNEDILPTAGSSAGQPPLPVILEEATRCPDDCPPPSPLNP